MKATPSTVYGISTEMGMKYSPQLPATLYVGTEGFAAAQKEATQFNSKYGLSGVDAKSVFSVEAIVRAMTKVAADPWV